MMGHDVDLEAQQQSQSQTPEEAGVSEVHVASASVPPSEINSGASGAKPVSTEQQVEVGTSTAFRQATGAGESDIYETDVQQDGRDFDSMLSSPVKTQSAKSQAEQADEERREEQATPATNDQPVRPGPHDSSAEQEPREIQDFDGSANALWSLYKDQAESHDKARIQTLKDDMDGVIFFAALFSAVLTSFIIDSKQNLKVNPADQMVYYLQQNVAMLNQISHQISSIAPQIIIPSSPPPPYPDFSPSSSNIRVNVFWFMALVFSLSSALLAILVQQWVREYMHVFQKYSDSLKAARLRQYLHDGCENWYMPVLAEAVPCLLHVSLFLFFAGLGDVVLRINTAVGVGTVVPIGLCGLFYTFTTFAPIFNPQSPYQNSFSGLIWYIFQRLHGRTFKDKDRRPDDGPKSVNRNMSEGQMQLAMEETRGRMMRDEKAIEWLIENMTEDAEMELLVAAIPGSFNAKWGRDVWRRVSEAVRGDENNSELAGMNTAHMALAPRPSVPGSFQGDTVVHELCKRVAHMLETCQNPGLFASDEQWRKRTRACIETTASLVGCANAELGWFRNIVRLLGDIGEKEEMSELMSKGTDCSFVLHWTCLSLMSIPRLLRGDSSIRDIAVNTISIISGGRLSTMDEMNARAFDANLDKALDCIVKLSVDLKRPNLTDEEVKEILHRHESQISNLEQINAYGYVDRFKGVDMDFYWLLNRMEAETHAMIRQLPGFQTEFFTGLVPIPFTRMIDLFIDPHKFPLFFPLGRLLESLCSLVPLFQDILKGQDPEKTRETLNLIANEKTLNVPWRWPSRLLQRQLWRLQDLRDGGGLGITVELFFNSAEELLSTSLSQESQSALYIGTFRMITSDWSLYKHSLGTQKLLLDAVASNDGIFHMSPFPGFLTDELLVFLRKVFDKQTGPHIDEAVQQLRDRIGPWFIQGIEEFRAKALEAISQSPSS